MNVILLIERAGLALLFAIAGAAKLVDVGRTRVSLAGFGVPPRLVPAAAVVLPLVELAVAVTLIPGGTAAGAGAAGAAVLVVFTGAIARVIARGERPECNCFGAVHSRPVGWTAVVRNVVLAAAAVMVAVGGPGETVDRALAGVGVLAVIVIIGLALQACVSYQLFRQNGRLIHRVRALEEALEMRSAGAAGQGGLEIGRVAPPFSLMDVDGRRRTLGELLAPGLPLALAFSDPDCAACRPILPRLARLRDERAGQLAIALVTRGGVDATRAALNGYAFDGVLLQQGREVAEAYRVSAVPSVVVVSADGQIASPVATGEIAIAELLGDRSAMAAEPAGPPG